jgi:iron(II)-dependent oxidoreductase
MGTRPEDFDQVMRVIGNDDEGNKDYRDWAKSEINPSDAPQDMPAFFMARYPTTVGQFRAFAQATNQLEKFEAALSDPDNQPVRYVTWHQAMAYCAWLHDQLKSDARVPVDIQDALAGGTHRVTLPSEAEWEYAARGSVENNAHPRRIFTWPEASFDPERANTFATRIGRPSAVGAFLSGVSPFDIHDLLGNVWEWTRSLWGQDFDTPEFTYPYADRMDEREKTGVGDLVYRVVRGGAFTSNERNARCAYRLRNQPDDWYYGIGFRIVVSPISLSPL